MLYLVSRFIFPFCSDFDLEATVVKTDKIRGLKQLFTPVYPLIFSEIINNYCIGHQKNYIKTAITKLSTNSLYLLQD